MSVNPHFPGNRGLAPGKVKGNTGNLSNPPELACFKMRNIWRKKESIFWSDKNELRRITSTYPLPVTLPVVVNPDCFAQGAPLQRRAAR